MARRRPPTEPFSQFCAALNRFGVDYIVIGSEAVAFHGVPRFSVDFDVFVRPTAANLFRVRAMSALRVSRGSPYAASNNPPNRAYRCPARSGASAARSAVATGSFKFTASLRENVRANGLHVERRRPEQNDHPVSLREPARQLFAAHLHRWDHNVLARKRGR